MKKCFIGKSDDNVEISLRDTLLNMIVCHAVIETGKESEMDAERGQYFYIDKNVYRMWRH